MSKTSIIWLCALLFVPINNVQANQTILFADSPYPPYVLGGPDDKTPLGGTAVSLVNQLFAELPNYDATFQLLPWKRVLKNLQEGSVDAVTMVAKTPEREVFLDFSSALIRYELALFYATSTFPNGFQWETPEDLSDLRIGVVDGYLSQSKLNEMVDAGAPLHLVTLSGTEQQLFGMLLKGRVDLICFKLESGKTLLRSEGWSEKIKPNSQTIYQGSYHLGFSKARQHQALIEEVNRIIDAWRQNGKLDAILHPHSPN